jgi:hypothetical protein
VWLLFLTGLSCCMHSPVGISVGANRERKALTTVAHLRVNAMNIFTYTLNSSKGSIGTRSDEETTTYSRNVLLQPVTCRSTHSEYRC